MAVPYYNHIITLYEEREARKIQRRHIRDVCDPFDLGDGEFQSLWRISKPMALYVVEKLAGDLEPQASDGLPVHLKLTTVSAALFGPAAFIGHSGDGQEFIKKIVNGENINNRPQQLLFTAPYKICDGGRNCTSNNFAIVFPLYVGNNAIKQYKKIYSKDYNRMYSKNPKAPFRRKTTRHPYTLCPKELRTTKTIPTETIANETITTETITTETITTHAITNDASTTEAITTDVITTDAIATKTTQTASSEEDAQKLLLEESSETYETTKVENDEVEDEKKERPFDIPDNTNGNVPPCYPNLYPYWCIDDRQY